MKRIRNIAILLIGLTNAHGLAESPPVPLPDLGPTLPAGAAPIAAAPGTQEQVLQPADIGVVGNVNSGNAESLPLRGSDGKLSLAQLEQMATANNPAIAQAEARVAALRGRYVQVGLPPNPTIGYLANEIGDEGTRRTARRIRRPGICYGWQASLEPCGRVSGNSAGRTSSGSDATAGPDRCSSGLLRGASGQAPRRSGQ